MSIHNLDPSRTGLLRRRLRLHLHGRFDSLKSAITQLVDKEDVLGLKQSQTYNPLLYNTYDPSQPRDDKGRWTFVSSGIHRSGDRVKVHPSGATGRITSQSTGLDFHLVQYDTGGSRFHHETELMLRKKDVVGRTPVHKKTRSFVPHKVKQAASLFDRYNLRSVVNAGNWRYMTDEQKLQAFQQWLHNQIQYRFVTESDALYQQLKDAYMRGHTRAFDEIRKPHLAQKLDFYAGSKGEFLRSAFNHRASQERVDLLAKSAHTKIKGITEAMSNRIHSVLVDGMIAGDNPREIAREMRKAVDGIGKQRSEILAHDEIIRAHAEGALDGMKKLGVEHIGVMVEWSTTEDGKVCNACKPLQGIVIPIDEAHGLFPRHPRCRCSPIPANLGEDESGQIRSKDRIAKAISESMSATPTHSKRLKALKKWTSARRRIRRTKAKPKV